MFLSAPASESLAYASPDLGNHHHARAAHESASHPHGSFSPNLAAGISLGGHVGAAAVGSTTQMPLPCPDEWSPPLVSPALVRFKYSWEAFIDSLLREWKTLNLVSALLLSCVALFCD